MRREITKNLLYHEIISLKGVIHSNKAKSALLYVTNILQNQRRLQS